MIQETIFRVPNSVRNIEDKFINKSWKSTISSQFVKSRRKTKIQEDAVASQ